MKVMKFAAILLAVGMFSTTAIAQDDCATAVPVPGPVDPCADTTPTGPLGNCTSGGGVLDQWLTFVATATAHRIRTDIGSGGTDSDFLVLSGACGAQSVIGCSEDEVGPYLGDICVGGLNIGDTYYIQAGTWNDSCPNGPYVYTIEDAPGAICGDGTISCVPGTEQCDDGNNTPGDHCDANCRIEVVCGDGFLDAPEQCDDGNVVPGDGCDADCRIEVSGVPAVSEWGLLVLVLIGLTVGTVMFGRRREATA